MNYLILTNYSTESIQNVVSANNIIILDRDNILWLLIIFCVFKLIYTLRNVFYHFNTNYYSYFLKIIFYSLNNQFQHNLGMELNNDHNVFVIVI